MMEHKTQLEKLNVTINAKFIFLTLLLVLLYSTIIFAQNTVYIDPTNEGDPNEDGSYNHPYSSWEDLGNQAESNTTYLQKRGTVDTAWVTYITNKSNVKCGAYGPGSILPKIVTYSDNGQGHPDGLFCITGTSHDILIDSLHLTGVEGYDPVLQRGIKIKGDSNPQSPWMNNITITNCEISYAGSAIVLTIYATSVDTLLIENCKIHDILAEGLWGKVCNPTVRNCHLYNINMDWIYTGEGGGDAIQLSPVTMQNGDAGNLLIEHNIVDRSASGNKFCLIHNSFNDHPGRNVTIRYNTFYPPKDTVGDAGGAALYIKKCDTAWIYGNKFIGKGYAPTEMAQAAAEISVENALYFYYNLLDSVSSLVCNGLQNNKDIRLFNNTFVNMPADRQVLRFYSDTLKMYNNVFAMHEGADFLAGTSTEKVDSANNFIKYGDPDTWDAHFGFIDSQNGDFHLTESSPAHNTGIDYYGYPWNFYFDNDSVEVPQGITRDIGSLEFDEGSPSNSPPQVPNQTFSVNENSASGVQVGFVTATDVNAAQTLTFSIVSGNIGNAFEINQSTGELTVINSTPLNFEVNPVISLIVQAKDNGLGTLTGQGTVSVNLNDINESPNIVNQSFSTNENGANNTQVGVVDATDPDTWQTLTYQIVSGNTGNAFQITTTTGVLSIANSSAINFELNNQFALTIKVTDNGSGSLTDQAVITVDLNDVNEAPVMQDQTFTIVENSNNGYELGNVIANDPDNGQSLTYTILSGNIGSAFYMESTTGLLIVLNNSLLNYEETPQYILQVDVEDNGQGNLSEQATITISLTDLNEAPLVENMVLPIDPFLPNGSELGEVIASDPDIGQTITFEIISGNSDNAFAINSASGLITVANSNALDPSVYSIFVLTVKVTDNGEGNLFAQGIVTLTFDGTNQQPMMNNQAFSVAENTQNGQQVGTVLAVDPDAGQNLTFTIMSGNTDGAFQINPTSGELTVANSTALNFESIPAIILLVEVEDDGIGNLTDQAIITVELTDVNEVPQIENLEFTIVPFLLNGSEVGQVEASDPDNGQSIIYEIINGNTNNAFAINPTTGLITVANSSALDPTINPSFTLTVQVTDNGAGNLFAQGIISVIFDETNQQPEMNNQTFTVAENTQNGQQVGTVIAVDPNAGQSLTFTIMSGNTDGALQINPSTGELTVANYIALNFEYISALILLVEVEDDGIGNMTDQAIITVELTDVNEAPQMEDLVFTIDPFMPNDSEVGQAIAFDPDNGQTITFEIIDGNNDNAFDINPETGLITVANSNILDPTINPTFTLTLEVTDNGPGSLYSQGTVTLTYDETNQQPQIENQVFNLAENTENGLQVGMVIAVDPNIGQNLTYVIITGNTDGAFHINSITGELTVANSTALDFENGAYFILLVAVTDDGVGNLTDQAIITVILTDVNETPQIIDQTFSLEENSINGFEVGNVVASDPDAGQSVTYTIVSGNTDDAYYLDSTTGLLTVSDSSILDYEVTPEFNLLIEVVDNGEGNLSAQAIITILLIDVYDPPVGIHDDNQVNNELSFQLFPNPSTDELNIVLGSLELGSTIITIVDLTGNVVFEKEFNVILSEIEEKINIENFSNGLYFISVKNKFSLVQSKFVKM